MRARKDWLTGAVPALLLLGALAAPGPPPAAGGDRDRPALGYGDHLAPESPAEREIRLTKVRARREQPASILCHRGAAAFAPENTLEAYNAAMDYGADGCEVDVRRTADGVLVLFHDDMLDRLTDGFGTVEGVSYWELLTYRPRFVYGTADRDTRPPTLTALLELARRRAMLLHLDVKRPGMDAEIAQRLTGADMWDHVVAVNSENLPDLRKDPRLKLLPFKGPGLYHDRKDVDPAAVREQLAQPGRLVMVDDPRVAARELKRTPEPAPLPRGLRKSWPAKRIGSLDDGYGVGSSSDRRAREMPQKQLLEVLALPESPPAAGDRTAARRALLTRAWAAQACGLRGVRTPEAIRALETLVRRRTLDPDWFYHGLDGTMAIRALGLLRWTESVPLLAATFRRVDPALEAVRDPRFAENPLGWTDFRVKMEVLPALGALRCGESKAFLAGYLGQSDETIRQLAPPSFEEATRSLLRQELTRGEIEALLRHPRAGVRGTTVLACLDQPTPDRRAALTAAAPWASDLPRARK